ncbi:MAG: beta-ureidopropionase [Rhodothermales bacterium]|jgi:beta-ureidopropionase
MRLALIQHIASGDEQANIRRALSSVREAAEAGAQVIAFPELAFTQFFPQKRLGSGDRFAHSHEVPGPLVQQFQDLARELGVVLVLNLFERDGKKTFDSSPVIDADGTLLGCTRMMHITHYEGFWEQDYYDPGDSGAPVYETAFGRIGVAICYDRHYPEYMRSLALAGADVIIIPQAGAAGEWPEGLFEAEMRVAAFHNGFYTALANRVGEEEVLTFGGGSFVCDPFGQVVARAPESMEAVLHADIDMDRCAESSARQLFLQHRRPDQYS